MPEWLNDSFPSDPDLSVALLLSRLAASFALGCLVAGIYHVTRRASASDPSLVPTLVLLTILITMVTLAIGNSVARAFSLVGALAIVRFRTVVEDTRDTAFVIFAVAVGMAVGAGFLLVPLVGIPFAAVAAYLFRSQEPAAGLDRTLRIRLGAGREPESLLRPILDRYLTQTRLITTATARQGAALDLTYAVRLRNDSAAVALVADLNGVEGVQEVELRS
jgi:uncharacterized membrane protein YhiD involved in acid resistance